MKRLVIFAAALAVVGLGSADVAAQKKAKEAEGFAKTLKADKDAKKRLEAAKNLYEVAELKAAYAKPHTKVLLDAFKGDPDAGVRAAAGSVLLVCEPDAKDVIPVVTDIVKDDKTPNNVLTVAANVLGSFGKEAKDAIPALQEVKKREEAKEDPKTRDQALLQAVNGAIVRLSAK